MAENERHLIGISKIARQKVIDRLKYAYAKDHLEEPDFERRLDLATNTHDREILKELLSDLPEPGETETAPSVPDERAERGVAHPQDTLVSFFSGVTRKGEWHPPSRLRIVAVLGGVDLDFTQAVIPPGGIDIDVFCVMGGIDMRIPEGMSVDARPFAFMGGVDTHGLQTAGRGRPTIRLRGFVLMGGVDVKPPKKKYLQKFLKKMFTDE